MSKMFHFDICIAVILIYLLIEVNILLYFELQRESWAWRSSFEPAAFRDRAPDPEFKSIFNHLKDISNCSFIQIGDSS